VPRREWPYIFANCSLVWDELGNVSQSFEPESIRREAETSLRRLKIDCFDLYQLGWPVSPNIPFSADGSFEDAWDMMATLQQEGKARFIGVSNCTVRQLDSLREIGPVTSLQAPYSLLRREIEDRVLPFCRSRRIGVIAYASIQSGLLTGRMTADVIDRLPHNDWRRRSPVFQEPARGRALAMVERLRAVGALDGRTPAQIAIAWALRNPAVTTVSVGLRHPHQVDEIVGAASVRLSSKVVEDLELTSSER
jgi:aryl-alcohol dehydrogenase-like predicted oxidoreductase